MKKEIECLQCFIPLIIKLGRRTNKLTSVDDQVTSTNYTIDIDDQSANNYKYDHIGNLTEDVAEGIDSIEWSVYGKIRSITRTTSAYQTDKKANLNFAYTPDGHRSVKGVSKYQKETEYTYYVRDAQGNVMAVYEMNNTKKLDSSLLTIANINTSLIGANGIQKFANFAIDVLAIHTESGMPDDYTMAVYTLGYTGDVVLAFDPVAYLNYNTAIQADVLAAYTYTTQLQSLSNYFTFSTFYSTIMPYITDANALEQLIGFMGVNTFLSEWNNQYSGTITGMGDDYSSWLVTNSYASPPPVTCINLIDVQTLVATQTTARFCEYLAQATAYHTYYSSIINTLPSSDIIQQMAGATNIGTIITTAFNTTDLFTALKENGLATLWGYILNEVTPQSDILDYLETINATELIKEYIKVLPSFVNSYITETKSQYLQLIKGYYTTDEYAELMAALTDQYYIPTQTLQLAEWHIYGSSRVGIYKANKTLAVVEDNVITASTYQTRIKFRYNGKKQYELSNHLGNVLVTISDRRKALCNNVDSTLGYSAVVITANDYYSFGSPMVGRVYESDTTNKYRYGFNKQENTNEIYGEGNAVDFGARISDTRLGRFLSVDPVWKELPNRSTYMFADNSPIKHIDFGGLFKWENTDDQRNNAKLDIYLNGGIQNLLKGETISDHLSRLGKFDQADLAGVLAYGEGPAIRVEENVGEGMGFAGGRYDMKTNTIIIDKSLMDQLQNSRPEDQQAALLAVVSVLLHETVHYGRDQDIDANNDQHIDEGHPNKSFFSPDPSLPKVNQNKNELIIIQNHVESLASDSDYGMYEFVGQQEVGTIFQAVVWGNSFSASPITTRSAQTYLNDAKKFINTANTTKQRQDVIPKP